MESDVKIETSLCNFNELIIKEPSHPVKEALVEKPIYVFPRYTNQVIDY